MSKLYKESFGDISFFGSAFRFSARYKYINAPNEFKNRSIQSRYFSFKNKSIVRSYHIFGDFFSSGTLLKSFKSLSRYLNLKRDFDYMTILTIGPNSGIRINNDDDEDEGYGSLEYREQVIKDIISFRDLSNRISNNSFGG